MTAPRTAGRERAVLNAAVVETSRRMLNRARLRIGAWILGGGLFGAITRLWLIRDRALVAIRPDGTVVIAECEALAEALYAPIPGVWNFTLTRVESTDAISPTASTGSDRDA